MDKIWDRKSFKVGGHWPLWRERKKRLTTQNRQKSTATQTTKKITKMFLKLSWGTYRCILSGHVKCRRHSIYVHKDVHSSQNSLMDTYNTSLQKLKYYMLFSLLWSSDTLLSSSLARCLDPSARPLLRSSQSRRIMSKCSILGKPMISLARFLYFSICCKEGITWMILWLKTTTTNPT